MKTILLALFVVAVNAVPLRKDNDAEVISVNEVPDGTALEVGDMKLKKHVAKAVVATELLHPYIAVGIAGIQAATGASSSQASVVDNDNAMKPKLRPIPEVILINPKRPVELPLEPEQLPVPAAHFNGPVPNDGLVQVSYNGSEELGVMSTLQEWYKMLVKYFNSASSPAAPVAPVAPIAHQNRY